MRLRIGGQSEYRLDLRDNGESAIVIGEFYFGNCQWKFRALVEGSAYILAAFGRYIGLSIDDASRSCSVVMGISFAVSSSRVLTCAYVIEDMWEIFISSFEERFRADPTVVDQLNDMALLQVFRLFRCVPWLSGKEQAAHCVIALHCPDTAGLQRKSVLRC